MKENGENMSKKLLQLYNKVIIIYQAGVSQVIYFI